MNIEETAEKTRQRIEKIKQGFQDNAYSTEKSISRQVVDPILMHLGWAIFDTDVVQYEYPLQKTKADIALLHKGKPEVIIEVKRLGAATNAEEQLFQYAYHAGVPLAVLTTGKEWEFYLPMRSGGYQDRQVYKLDICARETAESVKRLMRYLLYPDVCSGEAVKMAEADHGDKTRAKDIQDALPTAWDKVLSECDARLMELLKDKVGDICGFTPDSEVVRAFIQKQAGSTVPHQPQKRPAPVFTAKPSAKPSANLMESKYTKPRQKLKFELHGQQSDARNGIDTLVAIFEALIKRDDSFPDKFMQIHHGKSRRWLANDRHRLYPNQNESFGIKFSRQLSSGHWIASNNSIEEKEKIIKAACKVAGIQYGKDLKLLKV